MLIIDAEFKDLIPALTAEEYKGLEESICAEGCRDAIVCWNDTIVDGHNRYEICSKNNVPYKTIQKEFADRDEVKLWIMKNQLSRRNLNDFQRIEITYKCEDAVKAKAKERQLRKPADFVKEKFPEQNTQARDELGALAGVSGKTYEHAKTVIEKASEEVKEAVRSGDMSINQAYNQVRKVEKEKEKAEREIQKACNLQKEFSEDICFLFAGDIRSGLNAIEDESVDFIVTDPPYPQEYLPLYSDLSALAQRVLVPGGSLIVMSGQSYLPEVMTRLSSCMNYHWCGCYLTPGQSPTLYKKRTNTFWKPILWYVKGEYKGEWLGTDIFKSPENDKNFHKWGQSFGGMTDIIERFTKPGDIILDPFLGGGTTGAAALSAGRKFIGVDIEEKNIEISRNRIKEIYSDVVV